MTIGSVAVVPVAATVTTRFWVPMKRGGDGRDETGLSRLVPVLDLGRVDRDRPQAHAAERHGDRAGLDLVGGEVERREVDRDGVSWAVAVGVGRRQVDTDQLLSEVRRRGVVRREVIDHRLEIDLAAVDLVLPLPDGGEVVATSGEERVGDDPEDIGSRSATSATH